MSTELFAPGGSAAQPVSGESAAQPAPGGPVPQPAPARPFRRALYGTIAVLSIVIAGLVVLNLGQGPRLASAQINLTGAVERAGQRLLLQSNEPLAAIADAQVRVTPNASLTATSTASAIEVKFAGTLRYNTTYTVTVEGVRSASAPATSTFSYTFSTPDPTVYALVAGGAGGSGSGAAGSGAAGAVEGDASGAATGPSDRIVSTPLSGGSPTTVFTAPHIRRFVTFPDRIVVNTVNDDGTDALTIVSLTGAAPIPIQLAGPGTVTSLISLPGSNLFGYTYTAEPSPLYETSPDLLFAYDLTRGQDYTIPITGTDHEQFTAAGWMFVPGTTSLVARTTDGSLLLIDTLGEREGTSGAVPLAAAGAGGAAGAGASGAAAGAGASGAAAGAGASAGTVDELVGFVPGTKKLVTRSGDAFTAYDLGAPGNPATAFSLAGASTGTGSSAEPGSSLARGGTLQVLDAAGSTLRVEPASTGASGTATGTGTPAGSAEPSTVQRVAASGTTTLFAATDQSGPVTAVCLSPNAGYVVVETAGPPAVTAEAFEGESAATAAASTTDVAAPGSQLTYIDLADGSTVSSLTGSQSSWCST